MMFGDDMYDVMVKDECGNVREVHGERSGTFVLTLALLRGAIDLEIEVDAVDGREYADVVLAGACDTCGVA